MNPPSARAPRVAPVVLYEAALGGLPVLAVNRTAARPLDVASWDGPASPADRVILSRCEPPVLDVGCGPGRLVAALAEQGVACLGIDVSRGALHRARARGALVLRRAVEGAVPGEGRWGTVLLADGNVGIGGDPGALLARCRDLVVPGGLVLVEADPDPVADDDEPLVLRGADGRESRPMPWARAGSRTLRRLAREVGLSVTEEWTVGGRTVLALRRPAPHDEHDAS